MSVLTQARVEWNSVNLSSYVQSIDAPIGRETQDGTAMGDSYRQMEPALKTWSVSVTFVTPDAASGPVATLWSDFDSGTSRTLKYRASTGSIGATNPEYSGSAIITAITPVSGSVGDLRTVQVEFEAAGNLSRATS